MSNKERPYLEEIVTTTVYKYNPQYGNERICQCGHTYYRHFDSWADMDNVGCKYCWCHHFDEAVLTLENLAIMQRVVSENYPEQFRELETDLQTGFCQLDRYNEQLLELYFRAQHDR